MQSLLLLFTVVLSSFTMVQAWGTANNPTSPLHWAAESKMVPPAAGHLSTVGRSVALYKETLCVGAPYHHFDEEYLYAGTVFCYRFTNNQWVLTQQLSESPPVTGAQFGWALAIYEDVLAIAATEIGTNDDEDQFEGLIGPGHVVLYQQEHQPEWQPFQTVTAVNGENGDAFGTSLTLTRDFLAVGAPHDPGDGLKSQGSVYCYTRNPAGTGLFGDVQVLQSPTDPPVVGDAAFDNSGGRFGDAVSADGDWLAIGAPYDDQAADNAGAVYLYKRAAGTGKMQYLKTRVLMDAAKNDNFGNAISLQQPYLLVGARGKNSFQGAAYLYDLEEFEPLATFDPMTAQPADRMGWSVAMDAQNKVAVVGADNCATANGLHTGAAYVFSQQPDSSRWQFMTQLTPETSSERADFGWSVAVYNKEIAVGAPEETQYAEGALAGAVYMYGTSTSDNPNPAPTATYVPPLAPTVHTPTLYDDGNGFEYGWAMAYLILVVALMSVCWFHRGRLLSLRRRGHAMYATTATTEMELTSEHSGPGRGGGSHNLQQRPPARFSDWPMRPNVV